MSRNNVCVPTNQLSDTLLGNPKDKLNNFKKSEKYKIKCKE